MSWTPNFDHYMPYRSDRSDMPDRSDRSDMPDRSNMPDMPDRSDRSDRSDMLGVFQNGKKKACFGTLPVI